MNMCKILGCQDCLVVPSVMSRRGVGQGRGLSGFGRKNSNSTQEYRIANKIGRSRERREQVLNKSAQNTMAGQAYQVYQWLLGEKVQ